MKGSRQLIVAAIFFNLAFAPAQKLPPTREFQEAVHLMETKGDYRAALRLFEKLSKQADRALAARALLYVGLCQEKLGRQEARKVYERLMRDFPEQREIVKEARARLSALAQPPSPNASTAIARRVWEGPEVDGLGAPSPDGRYLSYVDQSTGDLAVRDLVTGENRRLTHNGSFEWSEYAEYSTISPDGKHVAYGWRKDLFWELRVLSMDGGEPRVLYRQEGTNYVEPAAWTQDGKHILSIITRGDQTNQLVFISVADGSRRVLKTLDWRYPSNVTLSPDGRYVLYDLPVKPDSPNRDIFILAADGSHESPLVEHPADDVFPLWLPDGRGVLFVSDRTGNRGAWLIRVAEGKAQGSPELIKADMARGEPIGFTRKGALYYAIQAHLTDVYVATLDPTRSRFLVPPEPLVKRVIGSNVSPEWSPDGEHVAYISGPNILSIRSLKTGDDRELMLRIRMSEYSALRWSRDGRFILVGGAVDEKGRQGHYLVDPQTGATSAVMQVGEGETLAKGVDWSADGKIIFYTRSDSRLKYPRVGSRDLTTGSEQELFPFFASDVAVSPPGDHLAVVFTEEVNRQNVQVLKIASVRGGEARELLRLQPPARIDALAWTPDGQDLLLVTSSLGRMDPPSELWKVPVEGGEIQRLDLIKGTVRQLRVHPDGQRIAFSARKQKAEIWVMENFLPSATQENQLQSGNH